ncbi:unnamed protein product [Leptosia nina]|uniref:Fibronectin type-III domain-containing protein n=1 Tax=Leptosia nina TaxID=320188 RepID=A0AAV1IX36_9NEOP
MAHWQRWSPRPPTVESRTSHSVTLSWSTEPYNTSQYNVVYILQKREKLPPWVIVYSGGKTTVTIDRLAPAHPHRFRLKIALKPRGGAVQPSPKEMTHSIKADPSSERVLAPDTRGARGSLQSRWSEECCTSTDSDGTTAACFCMAVRCGYVKQVQQMLEERPVLLSAVNASTGLTPLATAVNKGATTMVRLLLSLGADTEQRIGGGRTPLHLAVLAAHYQIVELLLEQHADIEARDTNGLRVEHLAVDSGDLETLKLVLGRGEVTVTDNNGWTPLFRAVCQGARTDIIQELVHRGSRVDVIDRAGLPLLAAARLLKDRHGRRRDSVLRLVDSQYQHEKVVANFTRLTKKISSVQALLK